MEYEAIDATLHDSLTVLRHVRHRLRGDLRSPDLMVSLLDTGVMGFTSSVQATIIHTIRAAFVAISHTFARLHGWLMVNARNTPTPLSPRDAALRLEDPAFLQHDPRTVVDYAHDQLHQHLVVIQPLLQRLDSGEWGFTSSEQAETIRTIRTKMINVQRLWDELHAWVAAHP